MDVLGCFGLKGQEVNLAPALCGKIPFSPPGCAAHVRRHDTAHVVANSILAVLVAASTSTTLLLLQVLNHALWCSFHALVNKPFLDWMSSFASRMMTLLLGLAFLK